MTAPPPARAMTAPPPLGRVVDLSLMLAEDLPCSVPRHMPFQHKRFNWFGELGHYHTRWLLLDEHTGTHFDAPSHAIPPPGSGLAGASEAGAVTSEQVPVELGLGPCAVIDACGDSGAAAGESPWIGLEALARFERDHREVAGEIVLLRTGWDARYVPGAGYMGSCEAPAWPAPTPALIDALAERGVRCLGTDGVSIGAAHDPGPGHRAGLSRGMVYVECLAGLAALPPRGAWFAFLPLKVHGGSGVPGRAIAIVPEAIA